MRVLTVGGPLVAREIETGGWELTAASGEVVYLRGVAAAQRGPLLIDGIERIVLEWDAAGVRVRVHGKRDAYAVPASSAIVHRSRAQVYEGLPLASFDAAARRFWRRIFCLMRLPGGRRIVGLIARRGGRPPRPHGE